MEELFASIQRMKDYYRAVDSQMAADRKHQFATQDPNTGDQGRFLANTVDNFVDIINNGIMPRLGTKELSDLAGIKLMDAGCGDSRSLAVGSLFGFDCYGLDLDEYLIEISRRASDELRQTRIIPAPFKVAQGTHNSDESYRALGISFRDIDYFIHSLNSMSVFRLIEKFAAEAKQGASLILLGGWGLGDFKEDADKHGLSMSEVYLPKEKCRVQGHYVFMTKTAKIGSNV